MRKAPGTWAVLVLACFLASGCRPSVKTPRVPDFSNLEKQWEVDTLYFGMSRPEGEVTQKEWQGFLREEVTPKFPEGLTSWEANGQWKDNKGELVKEKSRVLQLYHKHSISADEMVTAILRVYKKRFHQESVMWARDRAWVSF